MDSLAQFKEAQKQGWAHFVPLETFRRESDALTADYLDREINSQLPTPKAQGPKPKAV